MRSLLLCLIVLSSGCGYRIGGLRRTNLTLTPPANRTEHRGIEVELFRLLVEEIRKTPGLALAPGGVEVHFVVEECRGLPIYETGDTPVAGDFYVEVLLRTRKGDKEVERSLSSRQRFDERRSITAEDAREEALKRLAQSIALELLTMSN